MIVHTLFQKIDNTLFLCRHPQRECRLATDLVNFNGLLHIRNVIIFLFGIPATTDSPLVAASLCSHLPST